MANAIVSIPDRENFPMSVQALQNVPMGVDLPSPLFQELLRNLFTFDSDGNYYAKWWGAQEGAFPIESTERYRRLNVRAGSVIGDNIFVLANVTANFGLPAHADRQAGEYREFIAEILPDAVSGELSFKVINSAVKTIAIDGSRPRDHFDFCFFTAH